MKYKLKLEGEVGINLLYYRYPYCTMGILNQWLIAIFDKNSNFSHWSLWSDSVWTYILGAIFWKTVRKRVTIWFSELHLFFMFSLWILDVYLKILILTHFSPVKYFGKSKPTIWGPLKFFTSTSKWKKNTLMNGKIVMLPVYPALSPKFWV